MNSCLTCNIETKNPKFCSKSCSATYNNKGKNRHGTVVLNCKLCDKKLSTSIQKYCSHKCYHIHQYNLWIESWLMGDVNGKSGWGVSNRIRRWLHEKFNDSCSKCGWSVINRFTNKVPLQVNHIDGNWKNNRPENLELICPNCHTLTENYGARNTGNGRYRVGKEQPVGKIVDYI